MQQNLFNELYKIVDYILDYRKILSTIVLEVFKDTLINLQNQSLIDINPSINLINLKIKIKSAKKRHLKNNKRIKSEEELIQKQNSKSKRLKKESTNINILPIIKKFSSQLPSYILEYISNIIDIKDNGNYRYRVIAKLLKIDKLAQPIIRQSMENNLVQKKDFYLSIFRNKDDYKDLLDSIK